jgi:hypothetical protein
MSDEKLRPIVDDRPEQEKPEQPEQPETPRHASGPRAKATLPELKAGRHAGASRRSIRSDIELLTDLDQPLWR